jgi:carbonic anhydrase
MPFYTAITCIDGRIHNSVISYLQKRFEIEYVDLITEPGAVAFLAGEVDSPEAQSIFRRTEISLSAHSTKRIAITAHDDCAGNPVAPKEQQDQLRLARDLLANKYRLPTIALWVDNNWQVNEIT